MSATCPEYRPWPQPADRHRWQDRTGWPASPAAWRRPQQEPAWALRAPLRVTGPQEVLPAVWPGDQSAAGPEPGAEPACTEPTIAATAPARRRWSPATAPSAREPSRTAAPRAPPWRG